MAGHVKTRPEYAAPPEMFYNEKEALKYTRNTRMLKIQSVITERAIELLNLPEGKSSLLLDIGCGSALSGSIITEKGHQWVGMDISPDMLNVAVDREVDGDVLEADMGQGIAFRPGVFDGAISISALQWLFYPSKRCHNPRERLMALFSQLYSSLFREARAVFQFYPESAVQMNMAVRAAMACGFSGGVVVDLPNSTKAKKYYLTITAGTNHTYLAPKLEMDEKEFAGEGNYGGQQSTVRYENTRERYKGKKGKFKRAAPKSRDWIQAKKERQERQGKKVRHNSKYSGRKRNPKW